MFKTHGHTAGKQSPTYKIWHNMKDRCLNSNNTFFHCYGGRGITVCERWMRFENFLADMGERPEGLSIGRIDNNGNYEPGNCRWETAEQQSNNTRRTVYLTAFGQTLTLTEWSKRLNLDRNMVRSRLMYGWTHEDALTKPCGTRRPLYGPKLPRYKHRPPSREFMTIAVNSETRTIREWSRISGVSVAVIRERLRRGNEPSAAIFSPVNPNMQKSKRAQRLDRLITHDGKTLTLAQWAAEGGMESITLIYRLRRGWSLDDALTRPVQIKTQRKEAA